MYATQTSHPRHQPLGTMPYIAAKDMVPIVIAAALWGHQWTGSRVRCYCDNMAVVCSLNRGSSRDPQLMRLLHTLFFFCAAYDFSVSAQHVAGIHNEAAEALSRNNLSRFMSFHPPAQMCPSTLPPELLELVLDHSLLWTSPSWTRLFAAILNVVWHPQPYTSAQRCYASFCQKAAVLTPFPLKEDTLCRYVAHLSTEHLKHRTIKSYLSALRFVQIQQGLGDPFQQTSMPLLEYVLGIKRTQARSSAPPKRLPITPQLLGKLQQQWVLNPPTHEGLML